MSDDKDDPESEIPKQASTDPAAVVHYTEPPLTTRDAKDEVEATSSAPSFISVRYSGSVRHTGPLPPPEQLAAYEKALRGSGERILVMAEREQGARHRGEDAQIDLARTELGLHYKTVQRGQTFAFALGVVALSAATLLGALGKDFAAISTALGALAALTTAFVLGSRKQSSERGDHEEQQEEEPPRER